MFGLWFLLSGSQRLSFPCAGVVLAPLALERFLVRNGLWWSSNAEKGFVDPGNVQKKSWRVRSRLMPGREDGRSSEDEQEQDKASRCQR